MPSTADTAMRRVTSLTHSAFEPFWAATVDKPSHVAVASLSGSLGKWEGLVTHSAAQVRIAAFAVVLESTISKASSIRTTFLL